jgi:hypothetical protein
MTAAAKELHLTSDPGIARDHDPSPECWCRPSRTYPLGELADHAAWLHRGAQTRVLRLVEEKRQ